MDDQNPGLDDASGGAEDAELVLETTPEGDESIEPSGDPLDDIQDPKARDEAKKARAIMQRQSRKEVPAAKEPVKEPAPSPDYLTKQDFHKANERKAILEATKDPEIKANWSEIVAFFSSRRGKETPDDILEDIKDAIILYNARNPEKVIDTSATILTESSVIKSGGAPVVKGSPKPVDPPNFKLPTQPKEWYSTSTGK